MLRIKSLLLSKFLSLGVASMLIVGYPLSAVVLAESTATDSGTASASDTGPSSPPGADSSSYKYNEATSLWENDYYTWNPVTKQTSPKNPQTYSYNPETNMWDTTKWIWDAPSNKYIPNTASTTVTPAGASVNSIEDTGPDSDNTVNSTQDSSGTFDLFYNASITNNSNSHAQSGNASVSSNTLAGNSTSGDASSIANIINLLQSNWDPQAMPILFNANIDGNITGDLILDPNLINTTGPGSTATIGNQKNNNLTVNYDANGQITNNITLEAISGNSTVSGNTEAGNATTGDARVVANLVNMINSAISANKSFIGNLNINGSFNGDILLPPNFIDQLIAHSGPNSTVSLSNTVNNDIVANIDNTHTINNNTNLNAASGSAGVTGNTAAGSATSGNAETRLNVLNLTGKQVIDANTLLVFVNVLGQWVGMLVNAPSGSNSAAFCGGDCQINSLVDNNVNINATTNFDITNNLDLDAISGNALVSNNTKGGNALSGNASASANILNIMGSDLNTRDWLGILFINVNGFWNGSFGINTAAGNPAATTTSAGMGGGSAAPAVAKVFQFAPDGNDSKFTLQPFFGGSTTNTPSQTVSQPASASVQTNQATASVTSTVSQAAKRAGIPSWLPAVVAATVTVLILSLSLATSLYDRLWAASVTRASSSKNKPKAARPHQVFSSLRGWLTSLSWKFPLF